MDFNAKQAARSKHKHSQHLKRVHGGSGRGRHGSSTHLTHVPELDSNFDRYSISDEEAEHGEGELVRLSEGADLEQLLANSEQFYAQAHFRYRSFLNTIDTEPPPVDVAALEQELALEHDLLMKALSMLPMSELLGIQSEYIQACDSANDLRGGADIMGQQEVSHEQQLQQCPKQLQQEQAKPSPQHQQQNQQQERPTLPATLPGISSSRATFPPFTRQPVSPQAAATAQAPAEAAAAAATRSTRLHTEDADDDILQQLLTSTAVEKSSSSVSRPQQAPASGGISASSSRQPLRQQVVQAEPAAPAPVPTARPQPAATPGGNDSNDELDELLGLCGATPHPSNSRQQQPAQQHAMSSKKQSLEDWLDGF